MWLCMDRLDTCLPRTRSTAAPSPGASTFSWITSNWREWKPGIWRISFRICCTILNSTPMMLITTCMRGRCWQSRTGRWISLTSGKKAMASKMSDTLNAGWKWYCWRWGRTNCSRTTSSTRSKSTRTPNGDHILGGHAIGSVFSNCPVASGSGKGADCHRAVYRRHLHQARDSHPSHKLWVNIWYSIWYTVFRYDVGYAMSYLSIIYRIWNHTAYKHVSYSIDFILVSWYSIWNHIINIIISYTISYLRILYHMLNH